jgi:8-oxo-dGTP diphosphatase
MKLVKTVFNKAWIPYSCRVESYIHSSMIEFDAPVTTVHGFFLDGDKLLLVKHRTRGWEVPGGHVDTGESVEVAMRRELQEEAQMKCGKINCLGYLKKIALEDAPLNCDYPHPLSYCVFFSARVAEKMPFLGDSSIVDARFFTFDEATAIPWITSYSEYFEEMKRAENL